MPGKDDLTLADSGTGTPGFLEHLTLTANEPSALSAFKATHHPLSFMSHPPPTAASSSNQVSNFQLIINNALDEYKKRTKKDLLAHPLVTDLQSCNTPSAILSVLQHQVQGLDESQRSDDRWTRWLDPTVNVLFTLSSTLGEGVGLVCVRT
jgi:hypothetical protein